MEAKSIYFEDLGTSQWFLNHERRQSNSRRYEAWKKAWALGNINREEQTPPDSPGKETKKSWSSRYRALDSAQWGRRGTYDVMGEEMMPAVIRTDSPSIVKCGGGAGSSQWPPKLIQTVPSVAFAHGKSAQGRFCLNQINKETQNKKESATNEYLAWRLRCSGTLYNSPFLLDFSPPLPLSFIL